MARRDFSASIVEYGIQTSNGKTIPMVTEDRAEAERTLNLLGEGRLIRRTVYYTPWVTVPDETSIPG